MIKIVVNGTFDIVHRGHIELLNYAKSIGDWLLVCIDTDRRVKELKGEVAERATKALQNTITRLAKTDAEASALLNDRMVSGNQVNVLIDGKGVKYVLDADTVADIVAQLMA